MKTLLSSKNHYSCFLLFLVFFFFSCKNDNNDIYNPTPPYKEKYRPQIHFSAKNNWINDPNGMVYFDGEYHLFFQYNPIGSQWGNMSWGHAVSTDLIHWEELEVALRPDDLGDIFSGCCVVDKNNTAGFGKDAMIAVYTSSGAKQTQCLAYSLDKGRTFVKYDENPVLSNTSMNDFRDPKVFRHEDTDRWIMALATGSVISFYSSADLKSWQFESRFGSGIGAHGGVWECPDLFPLKTPNGDIKWILLVSLNPGGPNGGSATQYFSGSFDGKKFTADNAPYPLWLDYGRDNYAGVTWSNIPESDGRKILIGWMNNWDYAGAIPTYAIPPKGARGSMTLPRELLLTTHTGEYYILANKVINEIENIADAWDNILDETVSSKEISLDIEEKEAYQLELNTSLSEEQILVIILSNEDGEKVVATIDNKNSEFTLNRDNSGLTSFSDNFTGISSAPLFRKFDSLKVDIYVDHSSIEIFLNDGESVQTNQVFPNKPYNKLKIEFEEKNAKTELKKRGFSTIWK